MSNALRPWAFAYLYDALVLVAREHGYALALHGSMTRDLDLIAVPWTEDAAPADVLIDAITETARGYALPYVMGNKVREGSVPEPKPHGRLAWAIHMRGNPYIDISVMPLVARMDGAKPRPPGTPPAGSVPSQSEVAPRWPFKRDGGRNG